MKFRDRIWSIRGLIWYVIRSQTSFSVRGEMPGMICIGAFVALNNTFLNIALWDIGETLNWHRKLPRVSVNYAKTHEEPQIAKWPRRQIELGEIIPRRPKFFAGWIELVELSMLCKFQLSKCFLRKNSTDHTFLRMKARILARGKQQVVILSFKMIF